MSTMSASTTPVDPALRGAAGVGDAGPSGGDGWTRTRGWTLSAALVLLGVLVLGGVAVRFAPPGSSVAVWWPPAGLAAAFVLATGPDRRRAAVVVVGVVVASGLANWYGGRPPLTAAFFGVANASETAVIWALMTRGGRRPSLAALEDLGRLLLAALAGGVTFGVLAGLAVEVLLHGTFLPTAYAVAASHAAAVLTIAPLGLAARTRSHHALRAEDAVQWLVLLVVTCWIFASPIGLPLVFLPLPVLVWGATRLDLRSVAVQLLVVGVLAVVFTVNNRGPFAAAARQSGVRPETVGALTQAFLVTAAITALALAVSTVQRRQALADLRREAQFASVVLDSITTSIVVIDSAGRVERANPTAVRYLAREGSDVVGRSADELFPVQARPSATVTPATEPGRSDPQEQDWEVPGLGVRRMVWSTAYLTDGAGSRTHEVRTGVDVTDERASRHFLETLLDSAAATAIIGTDRAGVITLFNRGATNLLGRRPEDVLGTVNWLELHDPQEVAARAEELGVEPGPDVLVHEVLATGEAHNHDWAWLTTDGGRIVVDHTVSAIVDPSGRVTGFIAVAEDVTQRVQAARATAQALERERQAVEELTALDRAKTDFLSAVSHELRTPLTTVLGYTEVLEDGAMGVLGPRQLEVVSRIDRNGRRLLVLIEDLLINSRIESGQLELARQPVDLVEVADHAWEAARLMATHRDLQLHRTVPDHPVVVTGDPAALERVVTNLLSNAVKFTPDGGRVELELSVDGPDRADAHGATRSCARLVVRDTGGGIAESDRERVFRRFYRTPSATEQAIPGTGLGLSIVSAVVDAHDGSIALDSAVGHGSTFTVLLPLLGAEGEAETSRRRAPAARQFSV
jgi:PAS domain S-box-containing protein